jgi:hypothetical protein
MRLKYVYTVPVPTDHYQTQGAETMTDERKALLQAYSELVETRLAESGQMSQREGLALYDELRRAWDIMTMDGNHESMFVTVTEWMYSRVHQQMILDPLTGNEWTTTNVDKMLA